MTVKVRFPTVARRVGPGFARRPRRHGWVRQAHIESLIGILGERGEERAPLARLMQLSDRRTRTVVEEARLRGHLVIWQRYDNGPGGMYRLARTRAEYVRWKRSETLSRLGTFADQLRAMDRTADGRWAAREEGEIAQLPLVASA